MSGELVPAHDLLRWVEIENAKRYPDVFAPDEPVVATGAGRGHGEDPRRRVSVHVRRRVRRGLRLLQGPGRAEPLALAFSDDNLYWKAVTAHGAPEAARKVAERFGADRVGVFGEVFGSGVQDLAYAETGRSDRTDQAEDPVGITLMSFLLTNSWIPAAESSWP